MRKLSIYSHLLLVLILTCIATLPLCAQKKAPQDFGFRYLQHVYQKDPVNILVLSQKGEEKKKKPLFLFIQGSLPKPLVIYDDQSLFGTFPFKTDEILEHYHLAIIGKPFIPVVAHVNELQSGFTYAEDSTGRFPREYSERNTLDYYVARNLDALTFLKKQEWVGSEQLVVAGHSEGSTVAAKMALESTAISHLIYSGGNPLGRIMAMISQMRNSNEANEEKLYAYWQHVIANADSLDSSGGDTPKTTFQFSIPPIQYLDKLQIPVLIAYGTKDASALFNDYLRTEMMRKQKNNFSFLSYPGLEHNYFGLTPEGEINYDEYNWDKVALDWLAWLTKPLAK